jgi:hypothetical protein
LTKILTLVYAVLLLSPEVQAACPYLEHSKSAFEQPQVRLVSHEASAEVRLILQDWDISLGPDAKRSLSMRLRNTLIPILKELTPAQRIGWVETLLGGKDQAIMFISLTEGIDGTPKNAAFSTVDKLVQRSYANWDGIRIFCENLLKMEDAVILLPIAEKLPMNELIIGQIKEILKDTPEKPTQNQSSELYRLLATIIRYLPEDERPRFVSKFVGQGIAAYIDLQGSSMTAAFNIVEYLQHRKIDGRNGVVVLFNNLLNLQ